MKKKLLSFVVLSIFFVTVMVGCGASDSASSKEGSVEAAEGKAKKVKKPRGLPVKAEKVRVERVVDKKNY